LPPYQREDGTSTTAKDPKRAIWYAAGEGCGYWTDNWNALAGGGPPGCPHCGAVGFIGDAGSWYEGAKSFESDHPDYVQFLDSVKEVCGAGKRWMDRYAEFVVAKGGKEAQEG